MFEENRFKKVRQGYSTYKFDRIYKSISANTMKIWHLKKCYQTLSQTYSSSFVFLTPYTIKIMLTLMSHKYLYVKPFNIFITQYKRINKLKSKRWIKKIQLKLYEKNINYRFRKINVYIRPIHNHFIVIIIVYILFKNSQIVSLFSKLLLFFRQTTHNIIDSRV